MIKQLTYAAVITVMGILGSADTASAASYRHIDELAVSLQRQSSRFMSEIRVHYRHTPLFDHMYEDAAALHRLAGHAHTVAHRNGSVEHLLSDVRELDRSFHHLESLLQRANHGRGHLHGDTHHFAAMLKNFEYGLHHLRSDVTELMRLQRRRRGDGHGHGHGRYRDIDSPYGIAIGSGRLYYNGDRWGFRLGY